MAESVQFQTESKSAEKKKAITIKLLKDVMKGQWHQAVSTYINGDFEVHKAKITKTGDTVLHLAVSYGRTQNVLKMVEAIKDNEVSSTLTLKNHRGNTALHLAALLGDVPMCQAIASRDKMLITARNFENETPLFSAALRGNKAAFLYLQSEEQNLQPEQLHLKHTFYRRKDGDTILHAAISGEYMDLAFQIINYYPELVNSVNKNGQSPLHILASKPNLFESSNHHFGPLDSLIYQCVFVGPLEVEKYNKQVPVPKLNKSMTRNPPDKYRTCMDFFKILRRFFPSNTDPENPQTKTTSSQGRIKIGRDDFFPPNYATIIQYLKLTVKAFLVVLGLGILRIQEINERKQRHRWAKQVMIELVNGGSMYEYEDNGGKPPPSDEPSPDADSEFSDRKDHNELDEKEKYLPVAAKIGLGVTEAVDKLLKTYQAAVHEYLFTDEKEKHLPVAAKIGLGVTEAVDKLLKTYPAALHEYLITDEKEKHSPVAAKIGLGVTEAVDNMLITYPAAVHEYLITDEKDKHLPVAAKIGLGVTEAVDKLLKTYPAAVHEYLITDEKEKHLPVAAKIGLGVTKAVDKLKTYLAAVHEYFISADKNVVCETPFLIAARMGVAEMVEEILKVFPVAIKDLDSDNKNAVLLAVENRQPHVYGLLLKRELMKQGAFCQVDNQGNSALHLAAMAGGYRPWLTPGAALQMQWELKWYKFVKDSMPEHSFVTHNKKGQTPEGVFKETHQELIKDGTEWLTKTSESYSVVAALIATVAFSTSSSIPGGVNENSGKPKLGNEPAFYIFAISSVIALCCSVTALVLFLAILTSRFQEKNFATDLPRKLLLGLTSLFTSIASILISFCAGHFFILGDKVRNAAYPIYVATCLPVTLFALAQLPLYFDLIRAIVKKVPQRSYKEFPN